MVHYGLNKIKLAFDVQYENAVLTLLTYLAALASKATCLALASKITSLGLDNASLKPILVIEWITVT